MLYRAVHFCRGVPQIPAAFLKGTAGLPRFQAPVLLLLSVGSDCCGVTMIAARAICVHVLLTFLNLAWMQ